MLRTQLFMEPLHHDGAVDGRTDRARTAGIEKSREGVTGSDHHHIDAAGFEAFPRQTIPCHRFDNVPVLTKIARSLMLGRKFGLQTASVARIFPFAISKSTVCCPCSVSGFVRDP